MIEDNLKKKTYAKNKIKNTVFFFLTHISIFLPNIYHFLSIVVMKDPEDIAAYRKSIERQRVHIFFFGLGGDFEQVRGEILRKDPLPDLEECYALIRREAVRHASMKAESDNPDTSAMRGKLYYLDLQSKDSNKLRQALMARWIEGEEKFEIWLMTWLCLMKTKDEVNLLFQKFHKMIETRYNAKYLEGHGIIHQTTCSNTPQQNGVAKRKNWHLLEVVRASLIAAKTPISYWGEAITSAAYLINRRTWEYHKEIQTLDYDYHISKEDESDNRTSERESG
ncbi:hypothetical protein AAG906_003562 [Vitis piasezkii]